MRWAYCAREETDPAYAWISENWSIARPQVNDTSADSPPEKRLSSFTVIAW